ncbi:MAG: hypothetical protein RR736_22690, partial [Pseudomonas sp.]|uniref:hypothetical protein n=1 Tax=Pseudomonas sp. TaxID=306 RepID=UPI002FC9931E
LTLRKFGMGGVNLIQDGTLPQKKPLLATAGAFLCALGDRRWRGDNNLTSKPCHKATISPRNSVEWLLLPKEGTLYAQAVVAAPG